jgi:hypothetical protein
MEKRPFSINDSGKSGYSQDGGRDRGGRGESLDAVLILFMKIHSQNG